MGRSDSTYGAVREAVMGSVTTDVPDGAQITVNPNPPQHEPCPDCALDLVHGPHAYPVTLVGGQQGYTAHCPGWWPGIMHEPLSEYVPVDHSIAAREAWPIVNYVTWPEGLNGRELGQFVSGEFHGRAMHGERAFIAVVDHDRTAAVVAALVGHGWAVAKHQWTHDGREVELAVWTGL